MPSSIHPSTVHIVISDRGWILERLAKEISTRLPYVSYDTAPDPDAAIQYYMTYGAFNRRISTHQIGLFTHLEDQPEAARKFFDTAAAMDACVAMSSAIQELLTGKAARTVTISPGVDLARFSPRLRIGIIGRTYHTGRKGEDLVAAVQDIPDIEWIFTGEGWPGPSRFVPEEELPAFYRSLDYVLVPARIEGGPICVLEALACGVEVIAPPVGWVPQFPHLEFKTGDAQDLRRVLLEAVERRRSLRRSVEAHTWDNWAAQHHDLFVSIVGEEVLGRQTSPAMSPDMRAVVAVHEIEMTASAGGPSVRAPMTARSLKKAGVDAAFVYNHAFDLAAVDVVHILNVWEPRECEALIRQARKAAKPVVLSPIYLDLSEHDIFSRLVPELFRHGTDERILLPAYASIRARLEARRAEAFPSYEIAPDYYRRVRTLIAQADHVILLSEDERAKLRRIGAEPQADKSSIVHNPVAAANFRKASPDLFIRTHGLSDYVLVVGRIESRKNQLTLAFALRDLSYPAVFVGHNIDAPYLELIEAISGSNVHIIGRLDPNSEMLASAFAGARVFCLPSWSEGAPLAALEAGAAGCRMILSNRSSEREYFGDYAWYCDPADPVGMRELVTKAYEEDRSEADREALREYVRSRYNWDVYTHRTRAAYEAAIRHHKSSSNKNAVSENPQTGRILIDLTTLAHRDDPPSGTARTEDRLAAALHKLYPDRVKFFLWNSHHQCFLPVTRQLFESGSIRQLRGNHPSIKMRKPDSHVPFDQMDFLTGDTVVVFGSAWIRNPHYLRDLQYLKRACGVKLVPTVYDVIQWQFNNWFPTGVGEEFARNCGLLLDCSDRVLTCSQRSKDDILEFAAAQKMALPPIDVFRLGDDAESIDPDTMMQLDRVAAILDSRSFILYVSAIDVRKNHRLLLDIWERLIRKHGNKFPKLILVGSKGWGGDAVINSINASEILSRNVHVLHGINDVTLQWFYRNSLFTVYPSLYEGWGLPVAESLALGKFCIAANTGSLPEIAPDITDLIDPLDFMSWCERIERYALRPNLLREREERVETYRRHSWTEAAEFIAGRLQRTRSTEELAELSSGSGISFAAVEETASGETAADRICTGGWDLPERWGRWTMGTSALLCFRIGIDRPVALSVLAAAFAPEGCDEQSVHVTLNGAVIAVWKADNRTRWFAAALRPALLGGTGKAVIRLNTREPRVPAEYDPTSSDKRPLGLYVQSLTIEPILMLASDQWVPIAPDTMGDLLISFSPQADRAEYLVLSLHAGAAGSVRLSLNNADLIEIPVSPGEHVRVVRMEAPKKWANGFALLAIRSEPSIGIRVLEVGVFMALPPEIMRLLRAVPLAAETDDRTTTAALAHLPWYGQPALVSLGSDIRIARGSPAVAGLIGGWYVPEHVGTWSDGAPSSLYLMLPQVDTDSLLIEMTFAPYEWHLVANEGFELDVLIGTCRVRTIRRTDPGAGTASFRVPTERALDMHRILRITTRGMSGIAPNLFCGHDNRALSFMLTNLAVRSIPGFTLEPGMSIPLSQISRTLLLKNWHEPELGWAWSPGGVETKLQLPFLAGGNDDIHIGLDLEVYSELFIHGPATLAFFVDETEVATEVRTEPGFRPIVFRLPRAAADDASSSRVLTISAPVGISPHDAGGSSDTRPLSFRVRVLHYMAWEIEDKYPGADIGVPAADPQAPESRNGWRSAENADDHAPDSMPGGYAGNADPVRL